MNLEALEEAPLNNGWNVQQDLEILWGTSIEKAEKDEENRMLYC